jgi:smad nuclear-interacting protein 1
VGGQKADASYASIMVGAMAGRPTKRRGGNEDDAGGAAGQREVWGKPDEEPRRGSYGGGGSSGGGRPEKGQGGSAQGEGGNGDDEEEGPPKQKADFGLSGALAADAVSGNVLNGVVLKFSEPADARPPPAKGKKWRFYVFKASLLVCL